MGQVLTDCCKDPNSLPADDSKGNTPRPAAYVNGEATSETPSNAVVKPIDVSGAAPQVTAVKMAPNPAKAPAVAPKAAPQAASGAPAKADPNERVRPAGPKTTGEWDIFLQQWLVDPGYASAAGLAGADGYFYAATPSWDAVWWEEHVENILQDDDSVVPMQINETSCLLEALTSGTAPLGVWFGGNKYKVITREADFKSGDNTFTWLFVKRPMMGVHIVSTGASIIVGIYDEEQQQTSGNCKHGVVAVAEYLAQSGY